MFCVLVIDVGIFEHVCEILSMVSMKYGAVMVFYRIPKNFVTDFHISTFLFPRKQSL